MQIKIATFKKLYFVSILALMALFLSACVSTQQIASKSCETTAFFIDQDFDGGNFYNCSVSGGAFNITIVPEDTPPINKSPWYAFKIKAAQDGLAKIRMKFIYGYARYWPKTSLDKKTWTRATEAQVSLSEDGEYLELNLPVQQGEVYVSAQELITDDYFDGWFSELTANNFINSSVIGRSVQGRPIHLLSSEEKPEVIVLLGRAHPPEITGTLAMREFLRVVTGDSQLAHNLRERYQLVMVPYLNPDGVTAGHWRHNMNGVDLNRDWGPFTQPENQSVKRYLDKLEQDGVKVKLMLDFHSTKSDLFYTQLPDALDEPFDFSTRWFENVRERLPTYEFRHVPSVVSEQANSKNYFHSTYKIPAITYELGDETDRDTIKAVTPVFAQELMKLMLARP